MTDGRSGTTLVFFAVLAVTSYAIWQRYFTADEVQEIEPFTKGYALQEVVMDMTDEQGRITTRISAPSMVYYEDQELLHMTRPEVLLFSEVDHDWRFTAPEGAYHELDKTLVFAQAVELVSKPPDEQTAAIHINTSGLTVLPERQLASTEQDIRIQQTGMLLSGEGADIDLNQQEFRIKRHVKAEFSQ